MKKLLFLILCLCGISTSVYADAWRFDSQVLSGNGRPISGQSVEVCINPGLATTAAAVTSNIAILTMASDPLAAGFVNGETLIVAGFTGGDTYFNGTYTILSVTTTTIAYALTHANASAGTNGTARQTGDTVTGCAPLATIYTDYTGTVTATQPLTSDTLGNFGFWVGPSGQYFYQIYGPNVSTSIYYVTVGLFTGSSLSSISDLAPIFTTTIAGNDATFHLTNAAAHTFFGNNGGSSSAPSYTAWPGSTTQLFWNNAGALYAGPSLVYNLSSAQLGIGADGSGGAPCFYMGTVGVGDSICESSGLTITAPASADVFMGNRGNTQAYKFGGGGTLPLGTITLAGGGAPAIVTLNEGGLGTGIVKGPVISGVHYSAGGTPVPTCDTDSEGSRLTVTDSMSNTWGDTYVSGGADHILAYCDGTNWTVAAK